MKKSRIFFLTILAMLCWGATAPLTAQQTLTVTGYVLEAGTYNAIPNHPVNIGVDSTNGFTYYNTVQTNSSGVYTDVITIPANANVGNGWVWTYDCQQNSVVETFTYTPNITTVTDTFVICNSAGSCSALFAGSGSGNSYNFTDQSTVSGSQVTQWIWTFGDGAASSASNPSHTYAAAGGYPVCLTIQTSSGCTSTYCDSVFVSGGGTACVADFGLQFGSNGQVFFNNTSSGTNFGTFYQWSFGDGNFSSAMNPNHTYTNSGTYQVCLTIWDSTNCQDSYCDTISIQLAGSNCAANFNYQVGSNGNVFFSQSSTGAGPNTHYYWNFGDGNLGFGTSPGHTYSSPGAYLVCLTISDSSNNCQDTYCDTLVVNSATPCQANFTHQNGTNGQVWFQSSSTGTNSSTQYQWDFGDGTTGGSPSTNHTYAQPGTYIACLTIFDNQSCQSTHCDTITVTSTGPNCQAFFNYSPGTFGHVAFFDASTGTNFGTQFSWSFGDGNFGSGPNPSHIYSFSGTYNVCLTIWDSTNCQSTYCDTVVVTLPSSSCTASYTYQQGMGGNVLFSDNSSGVQPGASYYWDFGDGNFGFGTSPTNTYATNGSYVACLTVSDTLNNCYDIYCDTITVTNAGGNISCSADFAWGYNGPTVVFNDQSTSSPSGIASWFWDFGDGTTSGLQNPNHTYNSGGLYNVCLTIMSFDSCIATTCYQLQASGGGNPSCNADFTWSYSGNVVVFSDLSTSSPSGIATWAWDFGDGNTSTMANPAHNYASGGLYNVCLTIMSFDSCISTKCYQLQANGGGNNCQASFTVAPDSTGQFSYNITNTSTIGVGGGFYFWDFGDGNTSSQQFPTHTYASAGTYVLCLTVTDSLQSCTSTYCDSIAITNPGLPIMVLSPVLALEAVALESEVSLFPVPVGDQLNIRIDALREADVDIEVVSLSGQIIQRHAAGYIPQGQNTIQLDVSNLAQGMYFSRIHLGDQLVTKKFIVQ